MYKKYTEKIKKFYSKNRRMPSYSEIMNLVGFKSKNAVYKLVQKMMKDNILSKDRNGKLIPKNIFGSISVLGTVEAGFPTPAEEELSDTMTLDEYLIDNKEATFMLRVSGESMKDAGIMAGDMVLVERNTIPQNGDIVIAQVDNDWTMKYFNRIKGRISLEPANKEFKTIYPLEELKIVAVVKAVIRKY